MIDGPTSRKASKRDEGDRDCAARSDRHLRLVVSVVDAGLQAAYSGRRTDEAGVGPATDLIGVRRETGLHLFPPEAVNAVERYRAEYVQGINTYREGILERMRKGISITWAGGEPPSSGA